MNDFFEIKDFNALYFISDAHFGAPMGVSDEEKKRRLFDFGQSICKPGNSLFILGDLFDFWFEWRKVIPKRHFRVLREIASWRDAGLDLYYVAGNHDFRLGGFLEKEIGFRTFADTMNFTAGGSKFHLFHGDGVQKSDSGYRFLKKVFRSSINQQLFLAFHPDLGIGLADWSSSKSRESNLLKNPSKAEEDYIEYAEKKICEGFDIVMMGHTHRPILKELKNGLYMNTGNWYRKFSHGMYKEGKLTLNFFGEDAE